MLAGDLTSALELEVHHPRAAGSRSRSATAGEAFVAIAVSCLHRFAENAELLTLGGDAEALHQARVALRQLRSALAIFRPIAADERFDHLRGELRWLALTTNEARDLDTLIACMDEPPATLVAARAQAYARVLKALKSERARRLMREFSDWLVTGVWHEVRNPDGQSAAAFASVSLDRLRRKLAKKGRHLRKLDDDGLHEVRIAAKKLRYAADFFAVQFPEAKAPRRAKRFTKAMRNLQDELGEVRDIGVARDVLAHLHVPPANWPDLPDRAKLVEHAAADFGAVFDLKPYWR